jgi:hypothetical protein
MKKLKFKQVAGNIDSIYDFIENRPKMIIVKSIISDAIIVSRLSARMSGVLNAFEPNKQVHEFKVIEHYYGISNASDILKVKDQNLDVALTQIYSDMVFDAKNENLNTEDLAVLVLFQWLKSIKRYRSTYKLIA